MFALPPQFHPLLLPTLFVLFSIFTGQTPANSPPVAADDNRILTATLALPASLPR